MTYKEIYDTYACKIEVTLSNNCSKIFNDNSLVSDAAKYSLLGGGKRVRGVLTLAVCDMLCSSCEPAIDFAAAVEMIHAYSLIHDDLPCMDDDDFRRGQPSCHKAFNETNALLAGDALNTAAFEVISNCYYQSAENKINAVKTLAQAAGGKGMVFGQELDLFFEQKTADEQQLNLIHHHKTGDLINCAVVLGCIASNATENQTAILSDFAYKVGLVFQIVDDVLDVTSTEAELGKPIGSDAENGKTTFVTLKGVDGCNKLAQDITNKACASIIEAFGDKSEFLVTFAKKLVERNS